MDSTKIDLILAEYWQGETDLDQEQILHQYFKGDVADKHLALRPLFGYYAAQQQITLRPEAATHPADLSEAAAPEATVRSLWRRYSAIAAAVLALAVAAFFIFPREASESERELIAMHDTYQDPEEAYAEVVEALQFISSKMNQGLETTSSSLEKIKALNEQFAN